MIRTASPKTLFLIALLVMFAFVLVDHLTSPVMTITGAPSDIGNACAPCGAPCK